MNPQIPPALDLMLAEQRLVHALCLEGESAPALELAWQVAGVALCEAQQGLACGQCLACRKVAARVHADVLVIDWAGGGYKKDAVRTLRGEIYRAPHEGRAKVMIFPQAHTMSAEVQNLLLKVMEDPPEETYFVLLCDNRYRLLTTVLSRMVTLSLAATEDATLQEQLLQSEVGQLALPVLEAMAQGGGYALLVALVPAEKNRQLYTAVLETAHLLLGFAPLQTQLGLTPGRVIRQRQLLVVALRRNELYGNMPLISAALAEGIANGRIA